LKTKKKDFSYNIDPMRNKTITTKGKINMRNKPFFRSFLSKFFLFFSIDCSIRKSIYLSRSLTSLRMVLYVDQSEQLMEEVLVDAYRTILIEIQLHYFLI
jgi:hypothetical protein